MHIGMSAVALRFFHLCSAVWWYGTSVHRNDYEPLLRKAWAGLEQVITPSGEVGGIMGGCGIQASPAVYNHSGAMGKTPMPPGSKPSQPILLI